MRVIPVNIPNGFLMDGEDYPIILGRHLTLSGGGNGQRYVYVVATWPSRSNVALHRLVMRAPKGMQVDHINGDRLDNRKSNLRLVSAKQNRRNMATWSTKKSSKYKGVHFCNTTNKFKARIVVDYKKKFIGSYDDEVAAALAYDAKARELFGQHACLNFPDSGKRGCL